MSKRKITDEMRAKVCQRYAANKKKRFEIMRSDPTTTRFCPHCRLDVVLNMFHAVRDTCQKCFDDKYMTYRTSLRGFLNNLLGSMKVNSRTRRQRGREEAGKCSATVDDLLEIYEKQDGFCYYFKTKKMSHVPNSQWMMSCERLNVERGYTKDNIVLCCFEFNTSAQWTLEGIQSILRLRQESFDMDQFKKALKIRKRRKVRTEICYSSTGWILCNRCGIWKHRNQYNKTRLCACRECQSEISRDYADTVRGFINRMKNNAYGDSKTRWVTNPRKGECTLTAEKIIKLTEVQNGLCYYSGIPLVFKPLSRWRASVERLDTSKGYIDGNVVLICNEFNSTTTKCLRKTDQTIGAQWTNAKFLEFLLYLEQMQPEMGY